MNVSEKIGAFFDLDGTLLAPPSLEWRFLTYLLARDAIRTANVMRWFAHAAKNLLRDPCSATFGNKHYISGVPETAVADWESTLDSTALPLFCEGTSRMKWHLERGHRVWLVTGTLAPLARVLARRMPCGVEVCGTEIEVGADYFTGRLMGAHLGYGEKARVLLKVVAANALELAQSYAYGNQMADLRMIEAVGNPVAVNPSWRLARAARKHGWSIAKWSELRETERRISSAALAARVAR
jgi:HAD superfamily hydrolase (TIGR01490 family)